MFMRDSLRVICHAVKGGDVPTSAPDHECMAGMPSRTTTYKSTEALEAQHRVVEHIRAYMTERRLNTAEMARRLGCDRGNLSRMLRGVRVGMSLDFLLAASRLRRTRIDVLVEEPAEPPRSPPT